MSWIEIPHHEFDEMLGQWINGEEVERGSFLTQDGEIYLAADNTTNEFFVEEFESRSAAIDWLETY